METYQTHLTEMTRLPITEVVLQGKEGRALHVRTPHKGEVVIEYHTQGIFREKNREVGRVLAELRDLEWEAKEYLLSKWLRPDFLPIKE